jgi:hypothetical protein
LNDREIDELLSGAKPPQAPSAETLGRIADSIARSMLPVRPLPSRRILAGAVALICTVVAITGAAGLGLSGIQRMSGLDRTLVFSVLGIAILAAAGELASAAIPGSRRRFSSGGLPGAVGLCLAFVLGVCFRDYHTTHFVHAGLVCLAIGLLHSIVTGLLSWLVLRRGFAIDPVSTGLAAGILAGLAGVSILELHCANFEAAHVLVWHLGVLLVSAGLGALCGWRSASMTVNRDVAPRRDNT